MPDDKVATVEHSEVRATAAMEIVKRNVVWSVAAGLLPFPLVEVVAIATVQMKLIKELADHYGTAYRNDLAKSAVASLLAGLGSVTFGKMIAVSSVRFVPVIGPLVTATSVSAAAAGVTYAVGKVFVSHFEAGGTLLDFDPAKVRDYFRKEFSIGMKEAVPA